MSLDINLQLFAEGGEAGNAADGIAGNPALMEAFEKLTGSKWEGAAPTATEGSAAQTAEAEDGDAETAPAAAGSSPDPNDAGEPPADPDREFEELIRTKFRDQFGKAVQSRINDRFKNQRKAEKENEELWDAIDPYLLKSGVKRGDLAGLKAAAEKDRTNFTKLALEKGVSVEDAQQEYTSIRDTEKANRAKEAAEAEKKRQDEEAARQAVYRQWEMDETEIRQTDPDFSIETALKTQPEFLQMVSAGVSVKNAYRAVYYEKNMAAVAGHVYRQGRTDTASAIQSRANRPKEGALGAAAVGTVPGHGLDSLEGKDLDAFLQQKGLL